VAEQLGAVTFVVFAWNPACRTIPRLRGCSRILRDASDLIDALPDTPAPPEEAMIYEALGRGAREQLSTAAELLGLATNAALPPNAFYDAMRERLPIACRAGARLGDMGPMLDVAAGHFRCLDEDLPDDNRAKAADLFPLISRAVEANRVIEGLAGQLALLSAAFDRFDFGIVLTDGAGRLRLVNRVAREMMADGLGVAETSGKLATPTKPRVLEAAMAAAASGHLAGRDSLVALPRGTERPLLARVFSVGTTGVTGAGACVLLVDPDDPARLDASGIAALDLLTAAEAEVVALLVRGAGTDEISDRRDTTPETTRGQIRSAAAKLGCQTRVDLLRLAMATRIPLRGADSGDPP